MNFEGERERWERHCSGTQGVICVSHSVATIIVELNNCFSNYRCCETTVKATVCSSLLGENWVIECSAQQINDMVFATWQLVLIIIIIGKGGLLHIVSKHDMIWWNDLNFPTSLLSLRRKNWLICTSFSADPAGKSSTEENYTERRRCPGGATPINVFIFCVWIVLNLWWPQTSRNLLPVLSCPSFLQGYCPAHWFPPATVFLSALHSAAVRCIDISRTQSVHLGEQRWHV